MPQLIPTELEDGTIIYFQVDEPAGNSLSTTRSFGLPDNT